MSTVDDLSFSLTPPSQYELKKALNAHELSQRHKELKNSTKDLKKDLLDTKKVKKKPLENREKTDLEKYCEKEKAIRKALKNANTLKSDEALIFKQQHDEIMELIRLVIGNQILLCQEKILFVEKHFKNCTLTFISLESSISIRAI